MSFFENVLKIMDLQMPRPGLYGWFHLLWLAITAATAVALSLWHKRKRETPVQKVLLWVSLSVVLLEIYKQINYSFGYENGITFDYQWYAFPFQFCSTPMYIGLLAALVPAGKLRDSLCAYLATYSVFAGICVMLYPGDVFIGTIGINIQTMICHGSMIYLGVYLFASGRVKAEHKTILKAIPVFTACVTLACIMNEIAHASGLLERETFNMFFVSPYCEPSLPVYSLVQRVVPFPWNLVIYVGMFTLAAYLILLLAMAAFRLSRKQKVTA